MSRLGLLRQFDFRQLFFADTISQIGTQVTLLALPLVAVLALDATEIQVGLLVAAEALCPSCCSDCRPAPGWTGRRRRSVLVVGDLVRAVLLACVPIARGSTCCRRAAPPSWAS